MGETLNQKLYTGETSLRNQLKDAAERTYQQRDVRPAGGMLMAEQGMAARQSARSYLQSRAASLRAEADRMERLVLALPLEIHPVADEALWDLISRGAR
jgi:hypothetical protein